MSSLELRRVCETGLLLLAGTVPAAEVFVSSYKLIEFLISCNNSTTPLPLGLVMTFTHHLKRIARHFFKVLGI